MEQKRITFFILDLQFCEMVKTEKRHAIYSLVEWDRGGTKMVVYKCLRRTRKQTLPSTDDEEEEEEVGKIRGLHCKT